MTPNYGLFENFTMETNKRIEWMLHLAKQKSPIGDLIFGANVRDQMRTFLDTIRVVSRSQISIAHVQK